MGHAAIQRCDQSDRRKVRLRREGRQDARQVVRPDVNVAVPDDDIVITSVRQKLRQIANLAVGAKILGAMDEPDRAIGKIGLKLAHHFDRRIVEAGYGEENLVLAAICPDGRHSAKASGIPASRP